MKKTPPRTNFDSPKAVAKLSAGLEAALQEELTRFGAGPAGADTLVALTRIHATQGTGAFDLTNPADRLVLAMVWAEATEQSE